MVWRVVGGRIFSDETCGRDRHFVMPVVADFVQRAASTLRQEAPLSWNRGDREMQNNAQFLADGVVP